MKILFPALFLLQTVAVFAQPRVAFVVGNGAYESAPLLNAVNDAREVAQALREAGFTVTVRANLPQKEMKRAMEEFSESLHADGVALFYFAGHGAQVNGRNYLIPINSRISKESEVEERAIDLALVLAPMRSTTNIVILDACLNNPFMKRKGSFAPLYAPYGMLIAYATAPGTAAWDGSGRNGLYTQELLRAMRVPGLSIESVFKQVRVSVRRLTQGRQTPWETSSLTEEFCFHQ